MKIKNPFRGLNTFEWCLWLTSLVVVSLSFLLVPRKDLLTLTSSLIGVTALIFNAKGNPIGQALIIVFSTIYGIISFRFTYYGEMITYVGMTLPMAVTALVTWLKNPYEKSRAEVKVNRVSGREIAFLLVLSVAVTAVFYFILKTFGTANLLPSTLSVTTSFIAAYLTFRRSAYFALAYAVNDVVLIVLWSLASAVDRSYISVLICFLVFLINDLYGFFSWQRMERRQKNGEGQIIKQQAR